MTLTQAKRLLRQKQAQYAAKERIIIHACHWLQRNKAVSIEDRLLRRAVREYQRANAAYERTLVKATGAGIE